MSPEAIAAWWSFYRRLDSSSVEPFVDAYAEDLDQLNQRVSASGEPLEGNLFYFHHGDYLGLPPHPDRRAKRRMLAAYAQSGRRLLEIGFNAGHSALLCLAANPDLQYVGIDIGEHAYMRPCYDYLRQRFGERIEIIEGDSAQVLETLRRRGARFDLFHVDGGHSVERAYADLAGIVALSRDGQTLLLDDVNAKSVRAAANLLTMQGCLSPVSLLGELTSDQQQLFRIHRQASSTLTRLRHWRSSHR